MASLSADFPLTGVAYIAQIENEHMGAEDVDQMVCNNCYRSGGVVPGGGETRLQRCTGCKLANYCSRECQKKQWPNHKDFCALVQGKGAKNSFLSAKKDQVQVYRILIDSYRLRVENDHKFRGEDHGIYFRQNDSATADSKDSSAKSRIDSLEGLVWAKGDVTQDFQAYLDLAEDSGVLPKWWSFEERMECLVLAMDKTKHGNVFESVSYQELLTTFEGDLTSQFTLRIIAELIVGYEGKGTPIADSSFHLLEPPLEPGPEPGSEQEVQSRSQQESGNSNFEAGGAQTTELDEVDKDEVEDDIPLEASQHQS